MECHIAKPLLHAHLDQELAVVEALAVELHVQECASCRADFAQLKALSQSLQQATLYQKASPDLTAWVEDRLAQVAHRPFRLAQRTILSSFCGLAAGIALTLLALRGPLTSPSQDSLADQIIDNHIRSLVAGHLTDVASNDQHNVKPWFNGKLDFVPVVVNLAADGFPLVGGRIEVVNGRRVAALVYQCRQHYINVTQRPGDQEGVAVSDRLGYHLRQWSHGGLQFSVVSELDPRELDQFITLLKQTPS